MRLISFTREGRAGYGAVVGDDVVDLTDRLAPAVGDLRGLLRAGLLDRAREIVASQPPDFPLASVSLAPVIPNPDKIICIGLNYRSHVDETGNDLPEFPALFSRLHNTLLPHGAAMVRPAVSGHFDYEGELALVIGRPGRHIAAERALEFVAGYTCFNDGSVRDYQKHSVTAGKNFPATGPAGPWLVTADIIPDPTRLTLVTRLNGVEVQRSTTDKLIYSIPTIIAYVSRFTPLEPGDIIATGTPEGVGARRKPPLWMKPGDVVDVEIDAIGTLRNPVIAE